jgi:cytochrome c-type biogenesis protein CcmE
MFVSALILLWGASSYLTRAQKVDFKHEDKKKTINVEYHHALRS